MRRETSGEASGPCPFCMDGEDRFRIFTRGNYWCRQCGRKGWLDEGENLTSEEMRLRILEARQLEQERQLKDHELRLGALERMARSKDHIAYHESLSMEAIEYWLGEGISHESIGRYLLGFCERCPTDAEGRPSYTIPIINGGVLVNIRHRLVGADGDKYRPHMAGLGTQLFNADYLDGQKGEILVVEGEKKSIVVAQHGFPNVGICGKRSFRKEWAERLKEFNTVYVVLDPDATDSAAKLAGYIGPLARVVSLPVKPDDFFSMYGGSEEDLRAFLNVGRPV